MDDQDNAGEQGASSEAPTEGVAASSQQPTQPYPINSQSKRGIVMTSAIAVLLLLAVGGTGAYAVHNLQGQNQTLAAAIKRNHATATAVMGVMAASLTGWRMKSVAVSGTASAEKAIIVRDAKDLQAIVVTQTAVAKVSNATQTAIAADATATPTATPTTPYLTACFQENVSSYDGSCSPELSTFYQDAFNDITLSFTVPQPNRFHSSSITWRIFRSASSGSGSTELGSYYDNTVDPQNPGFTWQAASLFARADVADFPYGTAIPAPGYYKVEVLDDRNNFVCATTIQIQTSSYGQNSIATSTPGA